MIQKCHKKCLYIFMRNFSSIFEVIRARNCGKLGKSHRNDASKPNVTAILKRYAAVEPIVPSNIANEFIKKVSNLRCLSMDTLCHLPYYKCEDISAIIKFLSQIKYRDVILLQGLCEALYWQCSINKARLGSVTSVLSNLVNLSFVPQLRISKTFCDQLDNPKNKQSIGDYTRVYKFLVLTNLIDVHHFIQLYARIEEKCLNSMGLMNHSQLALISTILQYLPGAKWELMDRICANFQRKLHEIPMDSFTILLKNINKLRPEFKLVPRHCPPLIAQVVNNFTLDITQIITILQTMSIYYIRDTPVLSKLGKLLSKSDNFTLEQKILVLNIFAQLNYKHKEFLTSMPLETICNGISKLKMVEKCNTVGEVKELFQDFYPYISVHPYKFIQFSIAYINCLAKVDYNKREFVLKALDIVKQCNMRREDFTLLSKRIFQLTLINQGKISLSSYSQSIGQYNQLVEQNSLINEGGNAINCIGNFVGFDCNTTDEMIDRLADLLPQKMKSVVPKRATKRELMIAKFNYSKTGLLRVDCSVKDLLQAIAIKRDNTNTNLLVPRENPPNMPFNNLEEYRTNKLKNTQVIRRGGISLPMDCKVYRTKSVFELYSAFWNRTFGQYIQHPAHKRLQNRKLYRTMAKLLFRKRNKSSNKSLKHFQASRLYGVSVMLETSSGLRDKDEIRKLFFKRKRYSGSKRSFESNLTYVNKWRLLRRCFLRPYSQLHAAFKTYNMSSDSYLNSIVKVYKNPDLSGFTFDCFVHNSKIPIIYDTKPILDPVGDHVRMGKTFWEFQRIRDMYLDKWRESVTNILQLNKTNFTRINESKSNNKNVKLLVGGLESLVKLNCLSLKYLYYVIRQIKQSDGNPVEQLTLTNRLHRAISNYNSEVLQTNRNTLVDLYKKYIPLAQNAECKMPRDIVNFVYTMGNSLNIIQSIGALEELKIDLKQLGVKIIRMGERFPTDSHKKEFSLHFEGNFLKVLKFFEAEKVDLVLENMDKLAKHSPPPTAKLLP